MIPITAELAALAEDLWHERARANLRTREHALSKNFLAQHEQWHRELLFGVMRAPIPEEQRRAELWSYWLDTYGQPL